MARPGKKRLAIDIPIGMHDMITRMAHENYCTVTKFVMRALAKEIKISMKITK